MIRNTLTAGALAWALGIAMTPTGGRATTLTGVILADSDASGNAGSQSWNTLGGDGAFNLYLDQGAGFINSGNAAAARISVNLIPGSYTFNVFAEPGTGSLFALNLFFNSNDATPGISVFGPVNSSSFAPDGGSTKQLNGSPVAGANTATFADGPTTVALTAFRINSPVAGIGDAVQAYNNTPNQNPDFTGSFTLLVTGPTTGGIPEPASYALLGGGLIAIGLLTKRIRRA